MTIMVGAGSIQRLEADGTIKNLGVEPSAEHLQGIIKRDTDMWLGVARIAGLELQEIRAQYHGKTPVTPWFKAQLENGAELILGTRFRVFSVAGTSPITLTAKQWNDFIKEVSHLPSAAVQTLDGNWIGSDKVARSGETLEIHVEASSSLELIELVQKFANMLKGQSR